MKQIIEKLIEMDGVCRLDVEEKAIDVVIGPYGSDTVLKELCDLAEEYDMKGWTVNVKVAEGPDMEDVGEAIRYICKEDYNCLLLLAALL